MVPIGRLPQLTTVLATCLALGACGSSRFSSRAPDGPPPPPPSQYGLVYNTPAPGTYNPEEPVFQPAPPGSSVIASSPLPPPSGGLQGGPGRISADYGTGQPSIIQSEPGTTQPQTLARTTPGTVQTLEPATAPPATRSSVVGGWTVRDGTGASCRVQLSSTPALDLYKASAGGCPNKDLARVTAWDHRDGEVYLYQPGGTVVARLRQNGGGFGGVMTKSGATLAMNR